MKKLLSLALALLLTLIPLVSAVGEGETESISTNVYMQQVDQEIGQISATVPLKVVLELAFDKNKGWYEACSPQSYGITNYSDHVLFIQSIAVSMAEDYALIDPSGLEGTTPTSKQLVVCFDTGYESCLAVAAAGAQNVVVSALDSDFDSTQWGIPEGHGQPWFYPIRILASFPGGLDQDWYAGETKLFTVTYTLGFENIEREVM